MFKSALIPRYLDKDEYKGTVPDLRQELLELQFQMAEENKFPLIVLVEGVDGSGKADVVNRVYDWGDPHHLRTNAFDYKSTSELFYPVMWRYWSVLPPAGTIGFFLGSWYYKPMLDRISGNLSATDFESRLRALNRFEENLVNEGASILKFWLSLPSSANGNKKASGKPVHESLVFQQWTQLPKNEKRKFGPVVEDTGRITSTGHAPWIVVPSNDRRYRDVMVTKTICSAIRKRFDSSYTKPTTAPAIITSLDKKTVLDDLDLSLKLSESKYDNQLKALQLKLSELSRSKKFSKRGAVLVFEGNDAAGKGGCIRRAVRGLDPRIVDAHAIAAPTDEEKVQPYLWRFWRRIPKKGHFGIFDRSWYGRVLVERVEGFCSEAAWMRAYDEINDFENELSQSGLIIMKFWLAISKQEQLNRFKAREKTAFKRYKITDEDWRNREKWDEYTTAVGDMIDRTSTSYAPWTLVEAEDKPYARVKVLKTICDRIGKSL